MPLLTIDAQLGSHAGIAISSYNIIVKTFLSSFYKSFIAIALYNLALKHHQI